jgi:hypothetical protein
VKLSPRTQNFAKKNHKEKIVDEGRLEVPIPQISPTLHLKWSDTPSPSPDKDKAKGKVTEVSVINDSTFETDSPESSTPVAKSAVRHSMV